MIEKTKRYGKPCMTNLPADLGKSIFSTIMNTPLPDDRAVDRKAAEVEDRIRKARNEQVI